MPRPSATREGTAPFPSRLALCFLLVVLSSSFFCQVAISWGDCGLLQYGIPAFAACAVIPQTAAWSAYLVAAVVRRAFCLLLSSRALHLSGSWRLYFSGSWRRILATFTFMGHGIFHFSAMKRGGAAPFLLLGMLSSSVFCQQVIAADDGHTGSFDEAAIAALAAFLVLQQTAAASVHLLAAVVAGASRHVIESEVTDDSEFAGAPSRKRKTRAFETQSRAMEEREDYWASSYGKLLTRLRGMHPADRRLKVLHKKFRRLFRLSMPMFEELLVDCKIWKKRSGQQPSDAFNRGACPIDLLLLGTLQVLAAGTFFHHLEWVTGCSTTSHKNFFWWFCYEFTDRKMGELITRPKGDDLERVMAEYALLGLPGCVGSIDVTHVGWGNCPTGWQSWYTGKEGHPTLAYECVCDRQGLIRSATPSTPGSRNDKSICEVDDFVCCMREGMYGRDEVRYPLLDENMNSYDEFGGWLLCDGGYHRWRIFQCGRSSVVFGANLAQAHFAVRVASVRKDIECVFGALKGRWRVLKGNLLYKDRASVDRLFYTCCCLHNWLILADPDTRFGWSGKGWHAEDGHHEHIYYDMPAHARYEYTSNPLSDLGGQSSYTARMSKPSMSAAQSDHEPGWKELGDRLAVNYSVGRHLEHYAWTNSCLTVRVGTYSRE